MPKTAQTPRPTSPTPKGRPGPITRYRDKVRTPLPIQLPAELHVQMARNLKRLKVRRSDFICRLIEVYGDVVEFGTPADTGALRPSKKAGRAARVSV